MTQQTVDLRSSYKAVRRHSRLFLAIVLLGLLIGAGYAVIKPPMVTSTALVVLPDFASSESAAASVPGETDDEIATQVVVASSSPVLSAALPKVSPAISAQTLQSRIQVTSLAGSVISITATGATAEQAEATANAVADSYIAYVTSPSSPVGRLPAKVLSPAASASGGKLPERIIVCGLLGVLGGGIVGFIVCLAISAGDRRLVERDAIANSIGAPVLASIPVSRPTDAGAWVKLFDEYQPGVVHAWGLTKLLHQLGASGDEGSDRASSPQDASLTVVSLGSDPGALALGPQLAAFAATAGIPTALVVGQQQDVNVTATLRTACAALQTEGSRGKPLQFSVSEDADTGASVGEHFDRVGAAFVVVVTVLDSRTPSMPKAVPTTATVLGVSAGAATAEQLARAAMAAAADDREVVGILVANPDPADQTTGRIPRLAPPVRRQSPTRVSDVPTEIKR